MIPLRRIGTLLPRRSLVGASTIRTSAIKPVLNTSLRPQQYRYQSTQVAHTDDDAVTVRWNTSDPKNVGLVNPDGLSSYSHVWLRDNCPCDQCVHPSSRQKLHSTADVNVATRPSSITLDANDLVIEWDRPLRHQQPSTTHTSRYPLPYLRRYASPRASEEFRFEHLTPSTWDRDDYRLDWVGYDDYMTTEQGLHRVVQQLYKDGLVFLKDVPLEDQSVTRVAERIGPVQETFYGRDFDVKNVAKSVNIAYTSLYLGFHMDLM
jgi:hypothetical protein